MQIPCNENVCLQNWWVWVMIGVVFFKVLNQGDVVVQKEGGFF